MSSPAATGSSASATSGAPTARYNYFHPLNHSVIDVIAIISFYLQGRRAFYYRYILHFSKMINIVKKYKDIEKILTKYIYCMYICILHNIIYLGRVKIDIMVILTY